MFCEKPCFHRQEQMEICKGSMCTTHWKINSQLESQLEETSLSAGQPKERQTRHSISFLETNIFLLVLECPPQVQCI